MIEEPTIFTITLLVLFCLAILCIIGFGVYKLYGVMKKIYLTLVDLNQCKDEQTKKDDEDDSDDVFDEDFDE